jgi:hypothetical protein
MREIGGYIEFEHYYGRMLHEDAIALNCGRNCLAYLFKSRGIKKLKVPYFICNSIFNVCDREGVEKVYYHIDSSFHPTQDLKLEDDEWLYLVNLYGQLSNEEIKAYVDKYIRVIVDQANDYFAEPLPGVDTFYTCRKWFGVADGAFLYTIATLNEELEIDESYDRMEFLLGRFERTANEFYNDYNANNKYFIDQPVKKMSKLTSNLLHGIDYDFVEKRRQENFEYLHERLGSLNQLQLHPATFMYPLMIENGAALRKKLQAEKIYIPTLWPTVFEVAEADSLEYKMAENILPLPIDQRYGIDDMEYMIMKIREVQ